MTKEYKNVVGIDLGDTMTCVCLYDPASEGKYSILENRNGEGLFPSCVKFAKDGEILVGRDAKYDSGIDSESVVYAAKRLIGRKKGDKSIERLFGNASFKIVYHGDYPFIHIDGHPDGREERDYSPEEILAYVLSEVKDIVKVRTNSYPDACVITVPSYFSEVQREATKLAANIAGLNCIKLLSEPAATALAYKEKGSFEQGKVLVFDFGGSKLDVSIFEFDENKCKVLACAGSSELGGEDIDSLLCDEMIKRFVNKNPGCDPTVNSHAMYLLRQKCEEAKKELSSARETKIIIPNFFEGKEIDESITRPSFENLCEDMISQITDIIDDAFESACIEPKDIDHLIVVGGSSYIPFVSETLNDYFDGRLEPRHAVSSEEAVATGAVLYFNKTISKENNDANRSIILENQPISIGIKCNRNRFVKFIQGGKPYPQKAHYDFEPANPESTFAKISIYQGEDEIIDNHGDRRTHIEIGTFKITGLPGDGSIVIIGVDMEVDEDGILKITANINDRKLNLPIEVPSVLSREDVQEAMKRLEMKQSKERKYH